MINSFKNYLVEEDSTVYFTFGRMNPPTIGHEKLLTSLATKAGSNPYKVFLSQSQDKKKNPLSYKDKIKFVRKMFPKHARSIVMNLKVKTAMHAATELYNEGFTKIVMVVGSDRVADFEKLLKAYNNKKMAHGFYNFSTIKVISAGDRDPDADGAEGASASKQREAAKNNDFTTFSQGVPRQVSNADTKALFNTIRKNMGLSETTNFANHIKLSPISEEREQYINGTLFNVGDKVKVKTTESIVTIKHLGSNYVIVESANGTTERKWLDSIEKCKVETTVKSFKELYTASVDNAKKRIDREKSMDAKRHDRMMDLARTRDTQKKNKQTK